MGRLHEERFQYVGLEKYKDRMLLEISFQVSHLCLLHHLAGSFSAFDIEMSKNREKDNSNLCKDSGSLYLVLFDDNKGKRLS